MTVQSIERAFALLRALAVGPVGVTELAERVELPKSTVRADLDRLGEPRARSPRTGPAANTASVRGLLDIAGATQPGRNLVATARPHLIRPLRRGR